MNPKFSKKWTLIGFGAVVLLGVMGVGGWYALLRNRDPVQRAEQLERIGDLRAAQLEWRAAVARLPRDPNVRLHLAQNLFTLFDTVAAEKEFRAARALGADRWTVIAALGEIAIAQNRWAAVLAEVPPKGPDPVTLAHNLMLRSIAQLAMNDVPEARATLEAARVAAPNDIATTLIAARVALAIKDDAGAEAKVDQVLLQDPKQIDALQIKLHLLAARGDGIGARAIADRAAAAQPWSPPVLLDRANQLMLSGQDARAQADVDSVLSRLPRYPGALYLNALLLARGGRYSDAAVALDRLGPAIEQFPRALMVQSLVAANLGNVESAASLARRYHVRMPKDPDGVRLLARTELAARRPDRVVPLLEQAVGAGQTDAATLDLLGAAYADVGNAAAAAGIRQRAASLAPNSAEILTNLGLSQLRQGDMAAAAATLKRSVELAPAQPAGVQALVSAALAAGDFGRAEAAVEAFRMVGGGAETVETLAASILLARDQIDAARLAYAAIVKHFPDSVAAKVGLARILIVQGHRKEGEAILRETLAKDPASMPPLTAELQVLLQAGQLPQAITVMQQAQAAAPAKPLLTAMLADLLIRAKDPSRALALLQSRRDAGDFPAILLGARARAEAALGRTDDAIGSYRDQVRAIPVDLDARHALVGLLLLRNRLDEAKATLREGLVATPGTLGIMVALLALEARTNGQDAARRLAADLRQDPANLPASRLLPGDTLMQARQWTDAAQAYQAEFDRTPSAVLARRIAAAFAAAHQDDQAAAPLRRWLLDHPEDPDVALTLAQLDVKAARWPDAQTHLEAVLAHRPGDVVALNNLAWVYQTRNDPRARALAARAYMQAPTPHTADTLGWIMVQQNEAEAALPLLRQAAEQVPPNPEAAYHLAVALSHSGKPFDAVALLRSVAESPVPFNDRPAAMALLDELRQRQ